MKRITQSLLVLVALAALPVARAQTTTAAGGPIGSTAAGSREFTLGASGASNTDFDNSFGGIAFSYGYYLNDVAQASIRQSLNYNNSSAPGAGQEWNGSTRLAYDFHLASRGALRPFVGANIGGVYGEGVRDTFAAGVEAGGKYYVQPRTFVYALVEYGWFFRQARAIDDRFSDGQFTWSAGVGFNF